MRTRLTPVLPLALIPPVARATLCLAVLCLGAAGQVIPRTAEPDVAMRAAGARQAQDLSLVGEIPMGTVDRVAIFGELAVIAQGSRVATLSWSGADSLQVLGHSPSLPDPILDVALHGSVAFVASGGLHFLDVSDPTDPAALAELDLPPGRIEVAPPGKSAWAIMLSDELRVIALDTPGAPQVIGSAAVSGRDVTLDTPSSRAYVAAGTDGLHLVDLSDLSSPEPAGHLADVNAWDVAARDGRGRSFPR